MQDTKPEFAVGGQVNDCRGFDIASVEPVGVSRLKGKKPAKSGCLGCSGIVPKKLWMRLGIKIKTHYRNQHSAHISQQLNSLGMRQLYVEQGGECRHRANNEKPSPILPKWSKESNLDLLLWIARLFLLAFLDAIAHVGYEAISLFRYVFYIWFFIFLVITVLGLPQSFPNHAYRNWEIGLLDVAIRP